MDDLLVSNYLPFSSDRMRALVRGDNLTPGGEPDALVLLDMGESPLEIFDSQRLPDDHRVKRDPHHSRLLRAIGEQYFRSVIDQFDTLYAATSGWCSSIASLTTITCRMGKIPVRR
jgi:hypothetical protein